MLLCFASDFVWEHPWLQIIWLVLIWWKVLTSCTTQTQLATTQDRLAKDQGYDPSFNVNLIQYIFFSYPVDSKFINNWSDGLQLAKNELIFDIFKEFKKYK